MVVVQEMQDDECDGVLECFSVDSSRRVITYQPVYSVPTARHGGHWVLFLRSVPSRFLFIFLPQPGSFLFGREKLRDSPVILRYETSDWNRQFIHSF